MNRKFANPKQKIFTKKQSRHMSILNLNLDHIYCTDSMIVGDVLYRDTIYGDHKMVILCTSNKLIERDYKIQRRNWKAYSVDALIQNLNQLRWGTDIDSIQEMWNSYEQ
jgi:hypothetical protein